MHFPIKAILLMAIAAFPLAAADVTGHWSFEGDIGGNPVKLECEFTQTGTKLEGVCVAVNGDVKLAGEVSDPKVRFSYAVDYQGNTYTLYYSGTLASDSEMNGEIQVSGATGTFAGKKTGPKKPS